MQTAGETPALRSHKQRQRRPPEGGRYKFNRNGWRSKDRRYKTKTNGCPVPKNGTGRYKFNGDGKGWRSRFAGPPLQI